MELLSIHHFEFPQQLVVDNSCCTNHDWYNNCCLQPTVAETQSGEWRVAPLPTWGDEGFKTFHWGGTGFAIHKSSEAVDVAKKLLELAYFSYEGQIAKYDFFGGMPTLLAALELLIK